MPFRKISAPGSPVIIPAVTYFLKRIIESQSRQRQKKHCGVFPQSGPHINTAQPIGKQGIDTASKQRGFFLSRHLQKSIVSRGSRPQIYGRNIAFIRILHADAQNTQY